MLTGSSPQFLLDKLGERLAFERTGTRLYDALITKVMAQQQNGVATLPLEKLAEIREEEARHMEMVGRAIVSLGGDPTSMTPCADIAGVEALGLVQVLNDPRSTVMQSLHAILVVELTDNNGWEMLIMLAREQKHDAMADEFTVALERERDHLQHVQSWFQQAVLAGAAGKADAAATPAH
jgi:rubrerythrin